MREEFHQTYPLSATGRVSLENINGGVQIKVWDRAAVQVDAIKKAYRKDRLAEAKIEVNSTEENIRIKTEYPDENQNFRSDQGRYDNPAIVEYTLTVPRKAVLESIELINGSIDIDGVEGNVKASSINGKVMRVVLWVRQGCQPSMDHCKPRLRNSMSRRRSSWVQLTAT